MNDIQKAVACLDWQRFRKSLKGQPTEYKLLKLSAYGRIHQCPNCDKARREVQVLNYANALARAGLIRPLTGGLMQLYHGEVEVIDES